MKVLSGLMLLFALCGVNAYAQQEGRVIAEIAAGNEKMVKNAPFSAEAVSESVQVLADGNRIIRNSTSKLYRNSEGRFRREISGGSGGVLGTTYGFGTGISILDPVAGQRVMLNGDNMTARVVRLGTGQDIAISGQYKMTAKIITEAQRAEMEAKLQKAEGLSEQQKAKIRAELAAAKTYSEIPAANGSATIVVPSTATAPVAVTTGPGTFAYSTLMPTVAKYESRTEDLGTRDIEGVVAAGTRTVTTIPAGAIGNERPIEIAYERWYSKELEVVVYSKHSDPRFGEQTYRLTNIVRSEPDPSLFTVPQGYRVLNEPPSVYRISPVPARTAASPRTPQPARAVTVSGTKP